MHFFLKTHNLFLINISFLDSILFFFVHRVYVFLIERWLRTIGDFGLLLFVYVLIMQIIIESETIFLFREFVFFRIFKKESMYSSATAGLEPGTINQLSLVIHLGSFEILYVFFFYI